MNKLTIVVFLNIMFLIACIADLIATEIQIVSAVILIIVYYCVIFFDD